MHDLDAALARATEAIARRDMAGASALLGQASGLVPDGSPLARARFEGTRAELAAIDEDHVAAELGFALAYDLAVVAGGQSNAARWAGRLGAMLGERRRYRAAAIWHERAVEHARRSGIAHNVAASATQAFATLRQAHRHTDGARLLCDAADTDAPRLPASTAASLLEQARMVLDMSGAWGRADEVQERLEALTRSWDGPASERERLLAEVAASRGRHASRRAEVDGEPAPGAFAHYLVEMMAFFHKEGRAEGMADIGHLLADIALARAGDGAGTWTGWLEPWLPQRIVTDAVIATARDGTPSRALLLSQRWKTLGFAWPNLVRARSGSDPMRWAHPAEVTAYLRGIDELDARVGELRGAGSRSVQARAEAVRAAGETVLELGESLRQRDPALAARLGAAVWPEDLVDLLPPGSPVAIVDLVVGHDASLALIVFRRGDRVDVIGSHAPDFTAEHARELLEEWAGGRVAHEISAGQRAALVRISRLLHDRLFCGLARALAALRITQVVLIPDLLVRHLPLHLAHVCDDNVRQVREAVRMEPPIDQADMFCDVFPVEYAACLQSVAVSAPQKRPSSLRSVLSMADPRGDLPATRETARWLRERLPPTIETATHVGRDASLAALACDLPRADIAVMGCHGRFLPDRPLASHLELSDGPWAVEAIMSGDALERAPVVVLSACEVGARAPTVDEIEASGLPGALVSAGAAAVVASLWPVEDVSMSYLVERFVDALSHPGYRPAAALFRAVHLLQRWPLADAIARCAALMRQMEENGSVERSPAQYLMLDTMRERLAEDGAPYPFASAQYWGGVVVVGSGWHQPADGVVAADPVEVIEATLERGRALGLEREGKAAEALPVLEGLLDVLQGSQRAAVLADLAAITWRGRPAGCTRSARRAARRYLTRARAALRGTGDAALARRIAEIATDLGAGGDGGGPGDDDVQAQRE
ncbi:MAG TPA: CHAT domain-containing protein [Kofleriaceae bacterium]|nr:CHAT domain-containing protein [Kofleriaceae bacterium]